MIDWRKTVVKIGTEDEAMSVVLFLSGIGFRLMDETAQEFVNSLWEEAIAGGEFLAFPFVGCNSRGVIDGWRSKPFECHAISYADFVAETTMYEIKVNLTDFV